MRPQASSPDNIDPRSLMSNVIGTLPRIAVLAVLAGAMTFTVLTMVAPRYQSEAQMTIEAKSGSNPFADPKQGGVGDSTPRMDKEAINTHIGALRSPALAAEIVNRLKLSERAEFNAAIGDVDSLSSVLRAIGLGGVRSGQSEQDGVLEAYFANLQVFAARESRFISIRFTSIDPVLAAEIPNAIADAYRAQLASRQVDETQDVQDALGPKVAQLEAEVAAADIAVEQFRGKVDAFNAGSGQRQTLNEQQLGELTNELSRSQAARSEADARAQSGRDLLKAGVGEALPDVQKSPLIQNLVQQRVRVERQVAELNATLLPGHPRMLQLNADLAGLKKQITAEVAKIVDGLTREAKVAADREAAIRQRLSEVKIKVVDAGPDEAKLRGLVADAKSKRDELERLQSQFNANKSRVESKAVPVEAKLVSSATTSSVPVYPKKGPLSGLVALAAFIFGLAISVLRGVARGARPLTVDRVSVGGGERSPPSLSYTPQVAADGLPGEFKSESASALRLVGTDADKSACGNAALDGVAPSGLPIASSMAVLVDRVATKAPERGGYRSLVVGESAAVDATATAIRLARAIADAGHAVILVEWTHGPSLVASALGVPAAPGTADLITGRNTFEDVISGFDGSACHVITAGLDLGSSVGEPDRDQINMVLDALDEAYAHIVVTGDHDAARQLFELIEGRFDAGVVVGEARPGRALREPSGSFLGYEVADIDLVKFVIPSVATKPQSRVLRIRDRAPA